MSRRVFVLAVLASSSAFFVGGGWATDDFSHLSRLLHHPTLPDLFRSPDPFGFYRPIAHTTLLVNAWLFGFDPVAFRLTNVAIHVAVILLSYQLGIRLIGPDAGFLSSLAFVLTPKAHAIAVFWMSARPELVMAAFTFMAVISWTEWLRTTSVRWFGATAVCYVIATLSKETAILLPVVLAVTPYPSTATGRRRWAAAAIIATLAVVPIGLRIHAGALMPLSADAHYGWSLSPARWWRGIDVYLPRALPATVAVAACIIVPSLVKRRSMNGLEWTNGLWQWLAYGLAWFLVFIAPALPVVARSELYLYLPGFGFCLAAGHACRAAVSDALTRRAATAGLAVCVVLLSGYQVVRAVQSRRVLQFTGAFARAVAADPRMREPDTHPVIVAATPETERLLRDGIGGYVKVVLDDTVGSPAADVSIAYSDQPPIIAPEARLVCAFDGARVTFSAERR